MHKSRYSCHQQSADLRSHRIQVVQDIEATLDNPSGTERTALSILGHRTGKMLHCEKYQQQVPFGMREGNVTTQTLEWLYLDFINEAKIWVQHVYEAFGQACRIPLAPAGPVRQAHLHMINWFKGIFYGLFWKIVGARCTYAPDDAIPAIVRWEKRMAKMHINPVVSLLVLPLSSSAWTNIFLYITARTACFNAGEVGNLGTDSQAQNLAELVCDDWMTINTELLLLFGSKNWYRNLFSCMVSYDAKQE